MSSDMPRTVMVWGCSSGAGKSLLATALCRWAAQRGIDVAPYKVQNMSNNARVVPGPGGGFGEIGAAQYFQALAARQVPTVDMNPVLLKPERDTASQVVLHGRVEAGLSRLPWRERSAALAEAARASFERLRRRHALVVIEGAGSPAEINLAPQDYVNLGAARWARDAGTMRSLLVADIDRGGAFAHLWGTWALLPADLQGSVAGFVLNKFRGDAALLAPGPEQLQAMTGVPVLGVLPMQRDHGLPDEDGFDFHGEAGPFGEGLGAAPDAPALTVAIVATPRISNLDEFQPLRAVPGLRLRWVRSAAALQGADWIILPGSKQVSGDLAWIRQHGIDAAIVAHAAAGKPVLGICGGLQMLGRRLDDPEGVDGGPAAGVDGAPAAGVDATAPDADGAGGAPLAGLGLLPLDTHYVAPKRVQHTSARFAEAMAGPWAGLRGVAAQGYEIRHGRTVAAAQAGTAAIAAHACLHDAQGQAIGWQAGPVLGVYAHGLFECDAVLRALFGAQVRTLDERLDGLAALLDRHFADGALDALLRPPRGAGPPRGGGPTG